MLAEFWISLPGKSYDNDLGWASTALGVPGAKLVELRMKGETVSLDKIKADSSHVRFVNSPPEQPPDAVAKIRLEKRLISVDSAIVAALIGLIGTLASAYLSYAGGKKSGKAESGVIHQVDIDKTNTIFVPGSTLEAFIETGSLQAATASIMQRSGELNDAQIVLTPKTIGGKSGLCLQLNVTSPPGYQAAGSFSWRLAISQAGTSVEAFKATAMKCDSP